MPIPSKNINAEKIKGELVVSSISATTYQNLPSSGLQVGISQISSGTSGRIFFQSGTTLQQDSELFWDTTNKKLGVGKSPAANSAKMVVALNDSTGNRNFYLTLRNLGVGYGSWGFVKLDSNDLGINYQTDSDAPIAGTSLRFYYGGNSSFGNSLSVGSLTTPQARLDVRLQGALSTDVGFRIRNSIDTLNFAQFNGDGTYYISSAGSTLQDSFSRISDGRMFMAKSGGNFIELNPSTTINRLYAPNNGWNIAGNTNIGTVAAGSNTGTGTFHFYAGNLQIGTGLIASSAASMSIWMTNGTAPSLNASDRHWYYSADIVAGNAAPHFRTETGDIIKLYKNANTVSIDDNLVNLGVRTSGGTSSFTNPVTINNDLTVTGNTFMPNQIAFSVYGAGTTNNLTTTQNGDGTLNTNNYTTSFYQGSGFDVTTGIFTAPIAGLYQVSLIGRNSGYSSGISQLAVLKNNSNAAGNVMMIEWAASSSMNHTGGAKIFKLAIGDTLRLKVLAGEINFDGNDNWSVAFIG